jgi:hypothetical protein
VLKHVSSLYSCAASRAQQGYICHVYDIDIMLAMPRGLEWKESEVRNRSGSKAGERASFLLAISDEAPRRVAKAKTEPENPKTQSCSCCDRNVFEQNVCCIVVPDLACLDESVPKLNEEHQQTCKISLLASKTGLQRQ